MLENLEYCLKIWNMLENPEYAKKSRKGRKSRMCQKCQKIYANLECARYLEYARKS